MARSFIIVRSAILIFAGDYGHASQYLHAHLTLQSPRPSLFLSSYGRICADSICGAVVAGDFSSCPLVIRSSIKEALVNGLDAYVSSKLHSLLSEIFSSWPSSMPLLQSSGYSIVNSVEEAETFSKIQVLLKLGGFDDVDTVVRDGFSPLIEALKLSMEKEKPFAHSCTSKIASAVAGGSDSGRDRDAATLMPISSASLTLCRYYFTGCYAPITSVTLYLSLYSSTCLCPFLRPFIHLSIYPSIHPSV